MNPPNTPKRVKWTNHQVETLLHLAEVYNQDWKKISSLLKIKTPKQCKIKFQTQTCTNKKGKWTLKEDFLIKSWVQEHGPVNWNLCALRIKDRCGKQCRERWTNILDPSINKGLFTIKEQKVIFKGLQTHWMRWKKINALLNNRRTNMIKNFVNSTFRTMSNSLIVKSLKVLIIYPTYINKGKPY